MSGDETYPPALRAMFDEAEQLASTCARVEADPPDTDEYDDDPKWAAFVSGRASEIQLLVDEVASDWHQGKLTDDQAVQQLEAYLGGSLRELVLDPLLDRAATVARPDFDVITLSTSL
jgi:hypothetical protein